MSAQPQPHLTPEHYLAIERESEFRNEYYKGRMYAMPGGPVPHATIIGNLNAELRDALKKTPCLVFASDLRVLVAPEGLYTYPDIAVVCGEPRLLEGREDTLLNPALIVEVLSHSTEGYDRGFKFAQYRRVESLEEYALVWQTEPRVEVFRRQPGGHWLLSEFVGLEAAAHFDSVSASVPLAEIYEKVTFEEAAEL
jgi:Uma2 family endonuclease